MSDKNTEKTNSDKSLHAMMMSPSFMGSADASERSDFDLSKSSSNGLKDEQSGTTATEGVTATTSKDALAAEEAKAVALLKRLLVIFLSCVTIGATVATYFLARDYQTDEFQFQVS